MNFALPMHSTISGTQRPSWLHSAVRLAALSAKTKSGAQLYVTAAPYADHDVFTTTPSQTGTALHSTTASTVHQIIYGTC